MLKKVLMGSAGLALILSSTVLANTDSGQPKYDNEGNLILDTPQEEFKDLTGGGDKVEEPEQNLPELPALSGDKLPTEEEREAIQKSAVKSTQATTTTAATKATESTIPDSVSPTIKEIMEANKGKTAILPEVSPSAFSHYKKLNMTGDQVITTSLPIESVKSLGSKQLPTGAYTFTPNGNKINVHRELLEAIGAGTYILEVAHVNNVYTSQIVIKVLEEQRQLLYWEQSLTSFHVDPEHKDHQDFVIYTAKEGLDNVDKLTFNDIQIPPSMYRFVDDTIIISKDFLKQQSITWGSQEAPASYIQVFLKDGRDAAFYLDITDEVAQPKGMQGSTPC